MVQSPEGEKFFIRNGNRTKELKLVKVWNIKENTFKNEFNFIDNFYKISYYLLII